MRPRTPPLFSSHPRSYPRLHCPAAQTFFNASPVSQVNVPSTTGEFGILPDHVPVIAALKPGVVTVTDKDGKETKYFGASRERSGGQARLSQASGAH